MCMTYQLGQIRVDEMTIHAARRSLAGQLSSAPQAPRRRQYRRASRRRSLLWGRHSQS